MNIEGIAKKLKGLQTVSSISKVLNVDRRTAINYAWKLRKSEYLENVYGGKVKIYRINSLIKKKTGYSLYEILNENSKVKVTVRENYIIHSSKKPSIEEVLARAIASNEFRIVLASIGLFNRIKNWSRLKHFARSYTIERKVGALYDVARETIKVRKMDERTRKSLLNSKGSSYIIKPLRSKSFKNIEKEWKVFIPFNKQDLEVYKE